MARPKWIDLHAHVSDVGRDGKRRERLFEDLMEVFDRSDAELRLVISPDIPWLGLVKQHEDAMLRASELIYDLVRRAPGRLYGSCLVNPRFLDTSLRVMETCFEKWGFVQLGEMLQYIMGYMMDSDPVETLVRRAVDYGVPVQVHISTSNNAQGQFASGLEELQDLIGLAGRVPEANYILAHFVGMPDDNPPVVDAYLDLIEDRCGGWPENFWAEVREFSSPGLRSTLARVPYNRIVVGTDWWTRLGPPFSPYGTIYDATLGKENPYPPCVASMIDFLKQEKATDRTVEAIGFGNAAALLKIEQ